MGRISTLFQTIKDLNKDRWVRKYNPHQRFFVDVDWYNTEEDYLNALRDDWKSEADPFDECDHYVDVSKYDNFEDYEKAGICIQAQRPVADRIGFRGRRLPLCPHPNRMRGRAPNQRRRFTPARDAGSRRRSGDSRNHPKQKHIRGAQVSPSKPTHKPKGLLMKLTR